MTIENNLIKFEGKALEKLIATISNGIGTLYRPLQIRKEADAEAYRIKTISRAESEALVESDFIENEISDRIKVRLLANEFRRQENIDTVSLIAAEQLLLNENVSDVPVNEDWSTRFFNIAQDISEEELQSLWGRILAGEVQTPGSFSLRTLDVLRNINHVEAEIFTRLANFATFSGDLGFVFCKNKEFMNEKLKISFNNKLTLKEAGLITNDDDIFWTLEAAEKIDKGILKIGSTTIVINRQIGAMKLEIPIIALTRAGYELAKLIDPKVDHNFIQEFISEIKNEFVSVEMK